MDIVDVEQLSELKRNKGEFERRIESGASIAVHVALNQHGMRHRLTRLITWRFLAAKSRRILRSIGANHLATLAVYPSAESPVLVYELSQPAQRYTEGNLIAGDLGWSRKTRCIRRLMCVLAGVDVSAGSLVVVGRRK